MRRRVQEFLITSCFLGVFVSTLFITAASASAADAGYGWEYWKTLPDLIGYLDKTSGEAKADIGLGEEMTYHGILSMSSYDGAVDVFCDYDATMSGSEQDVFQITLNEESEGKYRLGKITLGQNSSDWGYYLGSDGYVEVSCEETTAEDGSVAYIGRYVNPNENAVYIVTYGEFTGFLSNIIVREKTEDDRRLYSEANAH